MVLDRIAQQRCFSALNVLKSSEDIPSQKYAREPYASVIHFLAPEFLKAGLIKVYEGKYSVKYFFGINQFLEIIPQENSHWMTFFFRDEHGFIHQLDDLINRADPAASAKYRSETNAVIKLFGLDVQETPKAKRDKGIWLTSYLNFSYTINAFSSTKAAFVDIAPIF